MSSPLNILTSSGQAAGPVVGLTWGLSVISVAVCVIVTLLVVAGALLRRAPLSAARDAAGVAAIPVSRTGGGLRWIVIGLIVSVLALFVSLIWTVAVLAAVSTPPTPAVLTLRVTGRQWWWQADYLSADPGQRFATANELHIPVGRPVRVELVGADVIHSFWVPQLAGKTDTIPGRTNVAWIEADKPGVYAGQCTEYCGLQHANMAFEVIAQTPEAFAAWRASQLRPAATADAPDARQGQALFAQHCGRCHTVRGVTASRFPGPDLTHLMSRAQIAAGTEPNTPAALAGWISNPQALKPGALMPATYLSGPELTSVTAYLETLR